MRHLIYFIFTTMWIAGIVIAKGFWSTLFSLIPLWAYYLVIERALQMFGVV